MKLESLQPSNLSGKKLKAVFRLDSGRTKTIHFGSSSYQDYTQHHDKARRANYLARHATTEDWTNPVTAGALSRHILWGNSTNIVRNIMAFRRRFHV